jgi:hypothetical protein
MKFHRSAPRALQPGLSPLGGGAYCWLGRLWAVILIFGLGESSSLSML